MHSPTSTTQRLTSIKQILKHYKQNYIVLEAGMFPCYEQKLYTLVSFPLLIDDKLSMLHQIYNNTSTFHCEIKKICFCDVITHYKLKPSLNLHEDDALRWVRTHASKLIQGAKFLCRPSNEEVSVTCTMSTFSSHIKKGTELNFAHKVLFHLCVAVYYRTSQKLLGEAEPFKDGLSKAAVILIKSGVSFFPLIM